MLTGRLSRAMLFASATLVGCDQGGKPVVAETGSAASKIEPKAEPKAAITTWKLHGVVKTSQGSPLGGAKVFMTTHEPPGQPPAFVTVADAQGRYQIEGPVEGRFSVRFNWDDTSGRSAYTQELVTLVIGDDQTVDAKMDPSLPAMPYGAPPARRRVV